MYTVWTPEDKPELLTAYQLYILRNWPENAISNIYNLCNLQNSPKYGSQKLDLYYFSF